MGATVVENPQAGVITSVPSFKFKHANDNKQAELPEFTKIPYNILVLKNLLINENVYNSLYSW